MPGGTIGTSMLIGYPGTFSRNGDMIIASRPVKKTDTNNVDFGDAVVLNTDNTYSAFGASNTAAQFAGVAVREIKQATDYYNQGNGYYKPGQPCEVLERGSVVVVCKEGTPGAGGTVYIATSAGTNVAIGDFCATATPAGGATTVTLTNAQWTTGNKDANGVAEITILNRLKP